MDMIGSRAHGAPNPHVPRSAPGKFLELGSIVLHYRFVPAGPGGRMFVFSNSLGTDTRIWDEVVAGLDAGSGALVYDHRGHGLSDLGEPPYRIDEHAQDLAALLDRLGLSRVVLVGLSVGGMVAQALADARPELVAALVLCDTAPRIGTPEMWNERIAAVERGGIEAVADAILERWFAPGFAATRPAAWHGCRNMLCRQPAAGYAGLCAAIRDADLTDVAARLSVPVLCVVGSEDRSTPPALVRALAELVPGAKLVVIEDAGHLPCLERPEVLAAHVRRFASERLAPR